MDYDKTYPADDGSLLDPEWEDDGRMPDSAVELKSAIVGRKIVKVERDVLVPTPYSWNEMRVLQLTLDDGSVVSMEPNEDCCAYTNLSSVVENELDHVITDVRHDGRFEEWYILADASPVLTLGVEWSAGNPFYYAYGFTVRVNRPGDPAADNLN